MEVFPILPPDVRDMIVVIVDENAPMWGGGSNVYECLAFVINNEYGDYVWARTITSAGVHAEYMANRNQRNFTTQMARQIKEDFGKKYDSALSKNPMGIPSARLNPIPSPGAYSVAPPRAGVTLSSAFSPQGVTSPSIPQHGVASPSSLPPEPSRTMPPYSSPDSPYAHIPYTGPSAPPLGLSSSTFSTGRVRQMFPLPSRDPSSGRNQYSGPTPP